MTINEINTLAEHYAVLYNPEKLTPFPYEKILETHSDLAILHVDLDDNNVSGVILSEENDKFTILINTRKSLNRQHFTLGHELGHYFLHKEILKEEKGFIDGNNSLDNINILYRLDNTTHSTLETEANHFAACLLMPSALVEEAWDILHDIEECARLFNVSTVAMSIRLTELKLVS